MRNRAASVWLAVAAGLPAGISAAKCAMEQDISRSKTMPIKHDYKKRPARRQCYAIEFAIILAVLAVVGFMTTDDLLLAEQCDQRPDQASHSAGPAE